MNVHKVLKASFFILWIRLNIIKSMASLFSSSWSLHKPLKRFGKVSASSCVRGYVQKIKKIKNSIPGLRFSDVVLFAFSASLNDYFIKVSLHIVISKHSLLFYSRNQLRSRTLVYSFQSFVVLPSCRMFFQNK